MPLSSQNDGLFNVFKVTNALMFHGAPYYVTSGHCNMFYLFNRLQNTLARNSQHTSWHDILKHGDSTIVEGLIAFIRDTFIDGPLKAELLHILRNRALVAGNVLRLWRTVITKHASRKDDKAYTYWHRNARKLAVITRRRRASQMVTRELISAAEMVGYQQLNPGLSERHAELLTLLGSNSMMVNTLSGVEFAMFNDDRTKRLLKALKKMVPQFSAIMPFGGGWHAPNQRQIEIEVRNDSQYLEGRAYGYFLSNMTYTSKACNRFISDHVAQLFTAEELHKFSYTMGEIHAEIFNCVKLDRFDKHSMYMCDMSRVFREIAGHLAQLNQQERADPRPEIEVDGQSGDGRQGEQNTNEPDHNRTTKSYKDRLPALVAHSADIQRFLSREYHEDSSKAIFAFYDYMQSIIGGEQDFDVAVLIEILARLRIGPLLEHTLKYGMTQSIQAPGIAVNADNTVTIQRMRPFITEFLGGSRKTYLGATGSLELLCSAMSNIHIFSCIVSVDSDLYMPKVGSEVTFLESSQREDLFQKLQLSVPVTDSVGRGLPVATVARQKSSLWEQLRFSYSWVFHALQIKSGNWLVLQYDIASYRHNRLMCMNRNSQSFILIKDLIRQYEKDLNERVSDEQYQNVLLDNEADLVKEMLSRPRNIPVLQLRNQHQQSQNQGLAAT